MRSSDEPIGHAVSRTAVVVDRLRTGLEHPALPLALAVVLAGFYLVTSLERTAFGVPFLLAWAAIISAFYAGWAAWGVASAALGRIGWSSVLAGAAMLLVAAAVAAGWYLLTRRVIGGVERPTALWSAGIVAAAVVIGALVRWRRPAASAVAWLLPVEVIAAWIGQRGYLLTSGMGLYDFGTYVAGGQRFLDGAWPYLTAPLERLPSSAAEDFFIYPPPLLPIFGWLVQVPEPLRSQLWIGVILLAAVAALRLIGLRWPFVAALMLFSPLIRGVESGNVANLTFLAFAAGGLVPALLPLGLFFKPQFVIPSLWLLRERRWRRVVASAVAVALIVGITLPLVGLDLWVGWFEGLRHREASQHDFPILFGWSLAQYMPLPAFVALSLVAVAVALTMRGTRSLAGLGLATIVASPTLWLHGFVLAIPALLALEAPLVWFALGMTDGPWIWLVAVAGYVGLFLGRWDRTEPISDPTHPLDGATGAWQRVPAPADRR